MGIVPVIVAFYSGMTDAAARSMLLSVDVFLVLDIVISFFTGFEQYGQTVTLPQKIAWRRATSPRLAFPRLASTRATTCRPDSRFGPASPCSLATLCWPRAAGT